jgi:hypothetical protein
MISAPTLFISLASRLIYKAPRGGPTHGGPTHGSRGAVDRHVGGVVVEEQKRDEVEVAHVGGQWIETLAVAGSTHRQHRTDSDIMHVARASVPIAASGPGPHDECRSADIHEASAFEIFGGGTWHTVVRDFRALAQISVGWLDCRVAVLHVVQLRLLQRQHRLRRVTGSWGYPLMPALA